MIDAARLRSFPLFGDLDEYDLSQVARWVVEVQAAPGELLIEQGSMPYELFVIEEGTVDVVRDDEPLASLGAGDVVGEIAPRPLLLIAAPNSGHGEDLNRDYLAAAHAPKQLWEIPESDHVGGISARPAEYERRVAGFFDGALTP